MVHPVQALAKDLELIFKEIEGMDAEMLVASSSRGSVTAASLSANDTQVNRLLLKVIRSYHAC